MKIAFIVNIFPALSETFILNQVTGLIDQGCEVDIYSLLVPSVQSKLQPNVKKYDLLNRTYYFPKMPKNYIKRSIKGLELLLVSFPKDPLVCLQALNFFKYGRQAASLSILFKVTPTLGKESYDIVHCQFSNLALEVLIPHQIGAIKGKLLSSFRGQDISRYVKQNGNHVYDELFREGDLFLSVCKPFRDQAIQLGCSEEKVIVHGSGIDCSKFAFTPRYLPSNDHIQVVTTSRFVEKKGIEYGIYAIAKLSKVFSNLRYRIIGDGPLRQDLQKLIQKLGVSDTVELLGWKHQQEVIEILNSSHIYIASSVTAQDGNQEGIPNALKEAMAMGLLTISSKHSGIPELVEDGKVGFLVPERDPDAIAEKLRHLIEHPEIWPEMSRAARRRVTGLYDIQRLNKELVEIYQKLLAEDRQHKQLRERVTFGKQASIGEDKSSQVHSLPL